MAPLLARLAARLSASWAGGDGDDVMLHRPSFAECIVLAGGPI